MSYFGEKRARRQSAVDGERLRQRSEQENKDEDKEGTDFSADEDSDFQEDQYLSAKRKKLSWDRDQAFSFSQALQQESSSSSDDDNDDDVFDEKPSPQKRACSNVAEKRNLANCHVVLHRYIFTEDEVAKNFPGYRFDKPAKKIKVAANAKQMQHQQVDKR